MKAKRLAAWFLIGSVAAAVVATATLADPFGRDALGKVVAACRISKQSLGLSFPCSAVDLGSPESEGYAVIRSPGFASEYLLTPLADYDGIETPELRSDRATNLWHAAWSMRDDVEAALGRHLPRTGLALAVNASGTRTQDHFHIHLDCLKARVGAALDQAAGAITDKWSQPALRLAGEHYWVRAIHSSDLAGVNIARLVAAAPPAASHPMAHVTLAVIGATLADGSDGFYLAANWYDSSAESLLDHRCRG